MHFMRFPYLFLCITLLFGAGSARAESRLGPMAGISMSNLTVSSSGVSVSLDSATRFTGGLSAEFGMGGGLYFQPEALYISKGSSFSSGTTTLDLNINYLEVPLLLKTKLDVGEGSTKIGFMAGPSVGFKLSSGASINGSSATTSADGIKSTEISLGVGAGIEGDLADHFTGFFDIRYLYGLTNVAKDSAADSWLKNRSWLFLVGGRFHL